MGRKSTYTEERADAIVEKLCQGIFLAEICRADDMPGLRSVYDWMDEHPEFAARVSRARKIGAESMARDAMDIIDAAPNVVYSEKGGMHYDSAHVQWNKNRVDHRMKMMAVMDRETYGQKVLLGNDPKNPFKGSPLASAIDRIDGEPEADK